MTKLKFHYFHFYFFLLVPFLMLGQELPPVTNFSPNEYAAGNQNWMISQGEDSHIFIANSSGLLKYNGEEWELFPAPNHTVVRSVKAIGKRVYTGAYMEMGFWMEDNKGEMEYTSLLSKFPEELKDGEQFWNIENIGKFVIFRSFEGLYIYNETSNSIKRIPLPGPLQIINLFKVKDKIYFQLSNKSLFSIENGQPEKIISVSEMQGITIMYLYGNKSSLNIVSDAGDFYNWSDSVLQSYFKDFSDSIKGAGIFSAIQFKDKSLMVGTVANGIYHLSPKGAVIGHFDQENGLINNTVLSLFIDKAENVWAGLDNGVSVVNLDSPFHLFQDHNGKIGSVYCSFQDENYLYLGTNQGLYYRRKEDGKFTFIEGTNGQIWSLKKIDGTLFCGHNTGTFVIQGKVAKKISERSGTWEVENFKPNPRYYIQGHYNGISFIKRNGDDFETLPMLPDFPHSSKFIVSDPSGDIWIGNEHKGVFRLRVNDSFTKIIDSKNYKLNTTSGITSSIFRFNDTLYYSAKEVLLQYNPKTDKFTENCELCGILNDTELSSGKIISDNEGKIWGFGEHSIFNISKSQFNNEYILNSIYLPKEFRNITVGYENITRLNSGKYLLGIANGYIKFDKIGYSNQEIHLNIDKIFDSALDAPPDTLSLSGNAIFPYKKNNIGFHFSTPVYKKFLAPVYSYRLTGLSPNWSTWNSIANASFKNLGFGEYVFEVRSKVANEISNTAKYSFEIERPWYLSIWALIGYVFLFICMLFFIHLWNRKHHKKMAFENERDLRMRNLEAEQKIIKLQNEHLERDIVDKNRELAVSTMSLIKKNEFLVSIKEKLKESESSKVKSVIQKIDKDISEEDNWKFFEKAFNNADKDFFNKVRKYHPDLTSNDLKLCAYLRLNLSSKEIAPLLNISVKSVEIKRYRLRKKMDLDRNTNLTEYILQI